MRHNRALDAAIALSRTPTLAAAMRAHELPTGVKLLLRILASDADALNEARCQTGIMSDKHLIAIAELYVIKVVLYCGAPARRVLAVGSDADRAEIRRHMGYLLEWLHPDKSRGAWPVAFATRVIAAWQAIDRGREDESPSARFSRRSHRVPWIPLPMESDRKSRNWRKVSWFVLVGMVIFGVALTTGVSSNQVIQLVSASSPFAASPASRSVFSLDR